MATASAVGDATKGKGGATMMPASLDAWLGGQRAALQEEREAERAEVADALAQLSPQVRDRGFVCR